ncbi:hypothetical protein [Streptomyces sp. NPDC004721]
MVLVDACFSGTLRTELSGLLEALSDDRHSHQGTAVVTAGNHYEQPLVGPAGRDGGRGVTTFVTCGSPLSWLCIREGVHRPGTPLSVPAGVEWTNLHSPNDVVNKGAGLSHLAVGVTDVVAHNGGVAKAHDVHRYLDKEAVVERIAKARTL